MQTRDAITAADVRAELARRRMRIYELAPLVNLHPAHLGAILNEHRPMPPDLADRISRIFEGGSLQA